MQLNTILATVSLTLLLVIFLNQESCVHQNQKNPAGAASGAMAHGTDITESTHSQPTTLSEPQSSILVVSSFWLVLFAFIPAFLLTFFPKIGIRIFVKNYRGMFTAS